MGLVAERSQLTAAEYLAWERKQPVKHEIEHYRRNPDGSWTYRTAGPGEHVVLTGGGELAVDAIYAGMFDLPGERAEGY